ncbi:MAG: glycosyltransferase, partial [Deltaproteobacteria bacterium]|nr:glycosyltransferase [Deltaproteobacteria bacterium]
AISELLHRELKIPTELIYHLPPMIPDKLGARPSPERDQDAPMRVGYAGKLAPRWGILELFATARALRERGHDVEVHVVGDKIHARSLDHPHFRRDVEALLESEGVIWHRGLSRQAALETMATMDLAWCYRSPALEAHTLELSTKLIEYEALGLPMVLTRSPVNQSRLGAGYPLLVDDDSSLVGAVEAFIADPGSLASQIGAGRSRANAHRISSVRDRALAPTLREQPNHQCRRIVVAGTDRKFVGELESHLKALGHQVKRDFWEWGEPGDQRRTRQMAEWADAVFCEWGLANAVWYSQNLDPAKRLVVRIHQQEVIKRAKRFPPQFEMDNIDTIAVVADHIRDQAIEMYAWQGWEDRIVTVPNFLNTEIFDRPKHPEAAYRIGLIGIVPAMHKRLDRALDLIGELRKRDPRFKLVIKGRLPQDMPWIMARQDEKEFYEQQFARLEGDLAGSVEISPFDPRLAAWYQHIGCVISPSNFESFHYSVAEGAASGALPVVWPWEGAKRIYPENWLVENVSDAVDRIASLMGDSYSDYANQAEANKQYLREHFGMKAVLDRLTSALVA